MSTSPSPRPVAVPVPVSQFTSPQVEDLSRSDPRFLFSAFLPVDLRFDLSGLETGRIDPGVLQPIVNWSYQVPNVDAINLAFSSPDARMDPPTKPFLRTAATIVEGILRTHAREAGEEGLGVGLVEIPSLRGLNVWRSADDYALWQAIQQLIWPFNYPTYIAQLEAINAIDMNKAYHEYPNHYERFDGALNSVIEGLEMAAQYCSAKRSELADEQADAARGMKGVRSRATAMDRKCLAWIGAQEPVKPAAASSGNAELERLFARLLELEVAKAEGTAAAAPNGSILDQVLEQNRLLLGELAKQRGIAMVSPLNDTAAMPFVVEEPESADFTEDQPAVFDDRQIQASAGAVQESAGTAGEQLEAAITPPKKKNGK